MNINEMFQAAESAPGQLGPDELPNGSEVLCEIVFSKAKTRAAKPNDDKGPGKTFSQKLKVIEPGHPAEGGEFFDSIHFSGGDLNGEMSDGQLAYNKRLFAKLTGAGLSAAFFASNPSDEAIAKALTGTKVRVKVQWQKQTAKQKESGDNPFLDNTTTWSPVDGGGSGGYVPGAAPVNPKGF